MTKQEALLAVGIVLITIAGLMILWAWPMLADGTNKGLTIFLWSLLPGTVGGSLIILGLLNGK